MKTLYIGLVAAMTLPSAAHAAAFINGDFEMGVDPGAYFSTLYTPSTDITGWTIVSGSIDYKAGYWQAGDGNRSIDLNGLSAGSIEQTFDTIAGLTYTVDFLVAGNMDGDPTIKTLEVAATGNAAEQYMFDITGHSRKDMGWEGRTYVFTATGSSTKLSFSSLTTGFYGAALDGISVTAVPEPTTWGLMIAGFVLAGTTLRRRKTTVQFA